MSDYARRKEQELNESNGNNENLQAQIDSLKKKIRELEVCFSPPRAGGVLDISLDGEVRRGPSYPDPV